LQNDYDFVESLRYNDVEHHYMDDWY
jgi:hypothetical protein